MSSTKVFASASAAAVVSRSNGKSSSSSKQVIFHWFRHGDLRLHDNPALVHTSQSIVGEDALSHHSIVPIFCFDRRVFGNEAHTTTYTSSDFHGTIKCSPRRARFILQCVNDLRQQLQGMGSNLVITHGIPSEIFANLLQHVDDDRDRVRIVCQEEPLREERDTVQAVESELKKRQPEAKVESIWGSTMYDLKDLPFDADLQNMPNVFTPFRTKVEKNCHIQKPLPPPKKLPLPSQGSKLFQTLVDKLDYLPTLQDLGYTNEQVQMAETIDPRGVMAFHGGETAALARMKEYIWDKDLLRAYFDTRNGMIGADYSSKFSPWLAHGCLSPRRVATECRQYEQDRVVNKSTYWLVFELLWRDFCKFFCVKHGNKVFYLGGTIGSNQKWSYHENTFEAWKAGKTGYPLVDANMRELAATGFMSNRGRQNVCSFLAIDLNYDWRYGADWFESHLLDYDVYSNWVNWAAGAGMTGGRLNRFNIVKQSKDYDQHGDYVRHWLPELARVPVEFVHEPWKMTQFHQIEYGVRLGVDYPHPIIPPSRPAPQRVDIPNHHHHQQQQQRRGGRGNSSNSNKGDGSGGRGNQDKTRKPNRSNHNPNQKYEMKSLKQGDFQIK